MITFRINTLLAGVFLAVLVVAPREVFAAPFCVQVTGIPPQCIYVDAAECRKRAKQLNGLCVGNSAELKIVPGAARYCLVNAARAALCVYPDMQSCDNAASREGTSVCVDSGPTQKQPDMFRTEPGRRY